VQALQGEAIQKLDSYLPSGGMDINKWIILRDGFQALFKEKVESVKFSEI
jgi:hypothetical protein